MLEATGVKRHGQNRVVSVSEAATVLIEKARGGRVLAAIVGPPGAGKSTLAEVLRDHIETGTLASPSRRPPLASSAGKATGASDATSLPFCMVVPMDGFHFDNAVLNARGLRSRKGAPETFDVAGLAVLLRRLRADAEPEIAIPVFDRDLEVARAGARIVPAGAGLLLVEGNYLLLDSPGWRDLRPLFDVSIYIDVPESELRRRLKERWLGYGLTGDALARKLDDNDLPNARLVQEHGAEADLRLLWHGCLASDLSCDPERAP